MLSHLRQAPVKKIFRSRETHNTTQHIRQTPCHYGFFDRWIVWTFPLSKAKQPITTNKQRLSHFVSLSPPRFSHSAPAMWFACVHRLTNLYTKKSLLTNIENIARDRVCDAGVCVRALYTLPFTERMTCFWMCYFVYIYLLQVTALGTVPRALNGHPNKKKNSISLKCHDPNGRIFLFTFVSPLNNLIWFKRRIVVSPN